MFLKKEKRMGIWGNGLRAKSALLLLNFFQSSKSLRKRLRELILVKLSFFFLILKFERF